MANAEAAPISAAQSEAGKSDVPEPVDTKPGEESTPNVASATGLNTIEDRLGKIENGIQELVSMGKATTSAVKEPTAEVPATKEATAEESTAKESTAKESTTKKSTTEKPTEEPKTSVRFKPSSSDDDRETKDKSKKDESDNQDSPPEPSDHVNRDLPEEVICEVRYCYDEEDFSNYYDDRVFAFEILVANDDSATPTAASGQNTAIDAMRGGYASMIRINSKPIIKLLGQFASEWKNSPLTFHRPFRYLIHFHKKMRAILELLNARITQSDSAPPIAEFISTMLEKLEVTTVTDESRKDLEKIYEEEGTVKHLQYYVDLIDKVVLPDFQAYHDKESTSRRKIRFSDLWYLFSTGDLVYIPAKTKRGDISHQNDSETVGTTQQRIWKVMWNICSQLDGCKLSCCATGNLNQMQCYHIDFDGERYGAVKKLVTFERWIGLKDITELPVRPLRYVKDNNVLLSDAIAFGKTFMDRLEPKNRHCFYNGWTLLKTPLGDGITNPNPKGIVDEFIKTPDHVESTVLVDFTEAFNAIPSWEPIVIRPKEDTRLQSIVMTNAIKPLRLWTSKSNQVLVRTWNDKRVTSDDIELLEYNDFVKSDHFLSNCSKEGENPMPKDDDVALLPRRLFAYSVSDRRFIQIDVRYLHQAQDIMKRPEEAFEQLQIPNKYKRLIEGLIEAHFDAKRNEASDKTVIGQDLIRGKGKGIIILLHGVPGVGKTATAEAIAEKFKQPLFPITCGDLGTTAKEVETHLTEIFRLAHLWNCILLLDEADVFITHRDRHDLHRNALVSVFLRILEYYNGILFLTTNRAGVLDEAVHSRVHLALKYDALSESQTLEIFRINMKRLQDMEDQRADAASQSGETYQKLDIRTDEIEDFARDHYHRPEHSRQRAYGGPDHQIQCTGRWNGRQIRNAFLIAASLAHFDGKKDPRRARELKAKHFETVEATTRDYEEYRSAIYGANDSELAAERFERNDGYRANNDNRRFSMYGSSLNNGGASYFAQQEQQFANRYQYGGQPQNMPPQNMQAQNMQAQNMPPQNMQAKAGQPIPTQWSQMPDRGQGNAPAYGQQTSGYRDTAGMPPPALPQGLGQQSTGPVPINGQANGAYGQPGASRQRPAAFGPNDASQQQDFDQFGADYGSVM